MATGLDGLLFTLTTTLIVARILAISNANRSPRQRIHGRRSRIILGNDLLYPRIVSEKIRHYANRRYYKYLPNQNTTTYTSIIKIILQSGDISTNPGPVKYPCGKCSNPVKRNQRGIYCEDYILVSH